MAHALDGARAKIERAGDHLEALDSANRAWVEAYSYGFELEDHPKTGQKIVRLRANRRPMPDPPLALGAIVGDALHNLRSALDHLVWELAIIGDGPGERNQFPIFDTPQQFEKKSPGQLVGVRPEHRTEIETHQPYHGEARHVLLRVLGHLSDVDKHRTIHARTQIAITGEGTLKFSSNVRSASVTSKDWTRLEDGTEIYRINSWEHTGGPVQMQADLRYTIVFGDPDTPFATSRRDLLGVRDVVANIVESFAEDFPA